MSALCFYFQVHQPYRLRHYTFFDIGVDSFYEDEDANCGIMLKVARKCYLPMNALLLKLIRKYDGRFKVSFSISGTALDQFEAYAPEVIQSFRELVATGCVELLSETYNHSLAFLYSPEEFREQVALHDERIEALFGVTPRIFRNTDKTVYCTTPKTYGTISRTKYRITVFRNIFGNLPYGFRRVQIIDKQRPAPFDTRIIPVF